MEKSDLLEAVKSRISEKIAHLERLIQETRDANTDTKSSMGDKYETGREMLQQEINNLQVQLCELQSSLGVLKSLNCSQNAVAGNGALVSTTLGTFYISVSAGEIVSGKMTVFAVSADSPIAKAMTGLKTDAEFAVNGIVRKILDIT